MGSVLRRTLVLALVAALAVLAAGRVGVRLFGQSAGQVSVLSPAVQAALAAEPQAEFKVWVHFAARDLTPAATAAALDAAAAALDPRTRARRARGSWATDRMVDIHDLPLDRDRLAACRGTGADLVHRSRWLNAASFRASAAQVARLARVDGVRAVTLVGGTRTAAVPRPVAPVVPLIDREYPLPAPPEKATATTAVIDYGPNLPAMEQANVVAAHDLGLSGAGVVVGLLDTGFHVSHEALADVPVLAAWDFVNGDANVDTEAGDPVASHNHGTMTFSALAGHSPGNLVAPGYGVSMLLAKTEDIAVEVPLEEDHWVAGLEWVESLGADIVSSSLGYVDWYDYADLDGNTAITTIAADLAAARGLVVVTSAGNDRGTTGYLIAPGDADSVITVGAVDINGNTAWFSSPGPTADGRIKPDVAALGVSNTLANPTDDLAYVTASGTSFACPLTSGVVALMLERVPALTPVLVAEALRATASQSATPDNDQGWGIVDALAAVTWFGPVIAHDPVPATTASTAPVSVVGEITDRLGLDAGTARLHYRVNGGPWSETPLLSTGQPGWFAADIPGQPWQTQVDYYLAAASVNGIGTTWPYAGADEPVTYYVTGSSGTGGDQLPALSKLQGAVPNPFNPRTSLRYSLARSGAVRLQVFDLQGRLVRTLLDGQQGAGAHAVPWDGRDEAGRAVASGTYLARLRAPDTVAQQKMLLVR